MKVSFLCTLLSCISHGLLVDTQDIDYYAVLGVRRTAGHDEVRSSYKALMLELHPDRNRQDLLANEKAVMINEAYHTLRDEYRRARYDREHQSAGTWEGTYGQFTYNYFERDAGYGQFAYNYLKRYATYIWKFVVKGGETEETSGDLGVFLAFTATFVYRSPAVMFLLLWVVVENKPHLFLMIWISAKLKKLEVSQRSTRAEIADQCRVYTGGTFPHTRATESPPTELPENARNENLACCWSSVQYS